MEEYKKSTEGQVMGIIGIVMGIISLIVAFIPCVGVVAFFPGGLAIIFSILSIVQASRGNGSKSLGIVSLIVSSLAIVLAALWLTLFMGLLNVNNEAFRSSKPFKEFEEGIHDAFKDMDIKVDVEETTTVQADSLENKLRSLELDTTKIK